MKKLEALIEQYAGSPCRFAKKESMGGDPDDFRLYCDNKNGGTDQHRKVVKRFATCPYENISWELASHYCNNYSI